MTTPLNNQTSEATLYCANHPTVETLLRCNRCDKPICIKCATRTPVGYRCKECINQQQNVYFNAVGLDNPIAFVVALIVTLIATPIVARILGFGGFFGFIIAMMAGSGAGGILSQIIRWAVGKRRGRYLGYFALGGVVLGILGGSVISWLLTGFFPLFSLPMLIFAFLAVTTAYQLLK